jgi:hypothetical protein
MFDLTVEGRIMLIFRFLDCVLEDRSSWAAFEGFNLLILVFLILVPRWGLSTFTNDLRAI